MNEMDLGDRIYPKDRASNKLMLYRRGFLFSRSNHPRKIYKYPRIVTWEQIKAIAPCYQLDNNGAFKIYNFEFHYSSGDSFFLPKNDVRNYIKIIKQHFPNEWQRLFKEDYEFEQMDWDTYEKLNLRSNFNLLLLRNIIVGVSLVIVLFYLLHLAGYWADFGLNWTMVIIIALTVKISILPLLSHAFESDSMTYTIVRHIKRHGETSIPLHIGTNSKFRKIIDKMKDNIKHVETFEDWVNPQSQKKKQKATGNKEEEIRKLKSGNKRAALVLFIIALIFISTISIYGHIRNTETNDYENATEPSVSASGEFLVVNERIINNTTLTIFDYIYVGNGGTLILENVTVFWSQNSDKRRGLYVESGGSINTKNCKFMDFRGELFGTARFENCTFQGLWGDPDEERGVGGIIIYNDDVVFSNCTLKNAKTNAIVIYDCDPVIRNCRITNCGEDAIQIFSGAPEITANDISRCDDGIVIYETSTAIVRENYIHDNENRGIVIYYDADPHLDNNRFNNIDRVDIEEIPWIPWQIFPIMIICAFSCFGVGIFYSYRKDLKKIKEKYS